MYKIKWEVAPAPSGRWKGFEERSWPMAYILLNGKSYIIGSISSESEYIPSEVKTGSHSKLHIHVACYADGKWNWRKAKGEFSNIADAKAALEKILIANPSILPPEVKFACEY